ncbi:MAG: glucose-6-phosphate isomerase [Thermodesulfobacteriota bacterium]
MSFHPLGIPLHRQPVCSLLRELAQEPFDLTRPGALSPERIAGLICRSGPVDVLYACQRVDGAVLDALQELADSSRAVDQFLLMKAGVVMNRIEGVESENRQVLHTAVRDIFQDRPAEPAATAKARQQLFRLATFLDRLDSGGLTNAAGQPFTDLVQIGIGGSDLGPRALCHALAAFRRPERRVHFIANVDPDDAAGVLASLDLSRSLVLVVSKSGSTLETLTNEALAREAFQQAGLDPARHFLAVTGPGSPMDDPGRYLESFHMEESVGGRFSATSMVGGVALGFALGYDAFLDILRGANDMDLAAEERDLRRNPALLLALLGVWNRSFLGCETLAVLPYSQALHRFTAHLQQCDMESNGKGITRQGQPVVGGTGPVVWGEPGTNGQHAFYQLLHQGTTLVPVEFIGFRHSQRDIDLLVQGTTCQDKLLANLLAQAQAMACGQKSANPNRAFAGNRPSSIIMAERLTPYTMGAILALYEAKIVFMGFIWDINSFDQEGVQLGKKLASRLLGHLEARRQNPRHDGAAGDPVGWALLAAADLVPPSSQPSPTREP